MGIMTFLRNRAGIIIVGAIGFAIIAFLLGDILNYSGPILNRNQNEIGTIDGESVDYPTFNNQVEMAKANFQQQSGGAVTPQMSTYIVENIWNQKVSEVLLNKEVERIGLNVGSSELSDLVTGQNPSPQLIPYFTNPQTGEFDRNQLNLFLNNIKNEPANSEQKIQWEEILKGIKSGRLQEKYLGLIQNSVYVTSLEANDEFTNRSKMANFEYILADYSSADAVNLTDADYKNYFNAYKNVFRTEQPTRSFDYVVFEAIPTAADSAAAKESIQTSFEEFKNAENDSLFAAIKSDTKYPLIYRKRGTLPALLDSAIFSGTTGSLVGPVYENGTYAIAKVLDSRMSPDSVQIRHILINPATEGGVNEAQAKADSLKTLVQNGASFEDLAQEFGTDASRETGGDLGTFTRGNMSPTQEFEDAIFNGKTGDLVSVNTQFGLHLIQIVRQVGSSRVIRAAIVDNQIKNSDVTLQAAFSKASEFFGGVNADNFEQLAQEMGIEVQKAERVLPMQAMVGNIDNPRELIRWAFEAKQGDISDEIIEVDNKNIIAKLTQVTPKGVPSLEQVKSDIEPEVRKQVQAKQLIAKINEVKEGKTDFSNIANQLNASVQSVENVVFSNPIIPGIAQESRVVGTLFGLQPTETAGPIEGEQGVYLVRLKDFVNPEAPQDLSTQKQQILQNIEQRIPSAVFQVLESNTEITDNRVRFY